MQLSKSLLFLSLIMGFLGGCTKPDSKPLAANGNSNFIIDSAQGSGSIQMRDPNSAWKVGDQAQLSFRSCVKDSATRADILNGNFAVIDPATGAELQSVRAIPNTNCISWVETLAFNPFAKRSTWITLKRTVSGRGTNAGNRDLYFAVNPWALAGRRDGESAIVYLSDPQQKTSFPLEPVAHTEKALSGDLFGKGDLFASEVDIKVIRQSDLYIKTEEKELIGTNLILEISLSPQVKLENAAGQVSYESIKNGDFYIQAQILATEAGPNQDQQLILLSGTPEDSGKIVNGRVKFEVRVSQTVRLNQGNLQLALQLIPRALSKQNDLEKFSGMYRLGTGTQIRSASASLMNICLQSKDACDFEKEILRSNNAEETRRRLAKLKDYAYANDPYIFENLKLRFNSVVQGKMGSEETATHRTVAYSASICITDRFTGGRLADTKFTIRYLGESTTILKATDASGCLNWTGEVFHQYYQPEDFIKKQVSIEKASGVKQTLTFYLNPWDDKFTFGWDERELSEEYLAASRNRKKIPSRFSLADYKYHTVRFRYDIDSYMDLEVKKTILIEIAPRVLRYSGILRARGNSEPLRDGIYLLKLAIQKSYLDPSDRQGYLIKNVKDEKHRFRAKLEKVGNQAIAAKDFVTTKTSLVRVVDGMIVYPIEMKMRDLRLMRVRSNFLIQLEPVDERLIQTHQALRQRMMQDLELVDKARALKEMHRRQIAGSATEEEAKKAEGELQSLLKFKREKIEKTLATLKRKLDQRESLINSDFDLPTDAAEVLKKTLAINDITELKLSKEDQIDLNRFVEKDSGLEKRTFVGPVIFLSNAYSDSVRATDNLDEACSDPRVLKQNGIKPRVADAELDSVEQEEILNAEDRLNGKRSNNAYETNPYFGALTNLCFKSVDDLIAQQKIVEDTNRERLAVTATKYNFADTFNLDYFALNGKPLEKFESGCTKSVAECMRPTREKTLEESNLLRWANQEWRNAKFYQNWNSLMALWKRFIGAPYRVDREKWEKADLHELFFGRNPDPSVESGVALCGLLLTRGIERAESMGLFRGDRNYFKQQTLQNCLDQEGVLMETRYHVMQTGGYTFKGGLQLNVNVGEDVSVGRSTTYSWSFDFADYLGPVGGLIGGIAQGVSSIFKPLKVSRSSGLSHSDRTSVSKSTYLVSQIAGFLVDLNQYEKCAVVRLSPKFLSSVYGYRAQLFHETDRLEKYGEAFGRGIMVCEGVVQDKPIPVEETYYYFTQHFTEGDMLDQADLYNHPWLLSLRGYRDFTTFLNRVSGQEIVNFSNFLKGESGFVTRPIDWPLVQMWESYRETLPSFPGFYSVLNGLEKSSKFPLDQRLIPLTNKDFDINSEVRRSVAK